MRTPNPRFASLLVATSLAAFAVGCGGESQTEEAAPAEAPAVEPTSTGAPQTSLSGGITPGASSTYEVAIMNPMPHAMTVTVEYDGGGSTELGTVPANGEQTFTVAASAGESVTLVAVDDGGTHSPRTTMVLPEGATSTGWTIQ